MKKGWIIGIIVLVIILAIIMGFIKFSFKSQKQSNQESKEFKANITIEDILPYCYASDHCIFDYIKGTIDNEGTRIIRSPQLEYSILKKDTLEKIADYLDPAPTGLFQETIGAKEKRPFLSKNIFLTKRVPEGDYILEIRVIDSLSSEIVTIKRLDVKARPQTAEDLLD